MKRLEAHQLVFSLKDSLTRDFKHHLQNSFKYRNMMKLLPVYLDLKNIQKFSEVNNLINFRTPKQLIFHDCEQMSWQNRATDSS